jgi:hypothetical protein
MVDSRASLRTVMVKLGGGLAGTQRDDQHTGMGKYKTALLKFLSQNT